MKLNIEAYRHRDFLRYTLAGLVMLHGTWILRLSIAWLAWDFSGQASVVGWIAFLTYAPTMISGPFFGALVDRARILRAAFIVQSLLAGLSLVLFGLVTAGWLTLPLLAVLALAIGIGTSAYHPVRLSLGPLLAPPEAVSSVVTASSINFNIARSIGPAIGGWLIAAYGSGPALLVCFLCTLPFLGVLPFLEPRPRANGRRPGESLRESLAEGLRVAWHDNFLRLILLATALATLTGRGLLEILPLVADGIFARGAAGLGVLTSAAGIGALGGAALVTLMRPPDERRLPRPALAAAGCGMAAGLVVAFSTLWPLTVAAVAAMGTCSTLVGVSLQSAMQAHVDDEYRGRVMSLWILCAIGGAGFGALALGALADIAGLGAGALMLYGAVSLLLVPLSRRVR